MYYCCVFRYGCAKRVVHPKKGRGLCSWGHTGCVPAGDSPLPDLIAHKLSLGHGSPWSLPGRSSSQRLRRGKGRVSSPDLWVTGARAARVFQLVRAPPLVQLARAALHASLVWVVRELRLVWVVWAGAGGPRVSGVRVVRVAHCGRGA